MSPRADALINQSISGRNRAAIENLTQYDDTPQFWYLTK